MTDSLGLYLHIPFCRKKCGYCDFYSVVPEKSATEDYAAALIKEIKRWGGEVKNRPIDTIYIGGGTPSVLGDKILPLLDACFDSFKVEKGAEITVEVNPESAAELLPYAKAAGINRISVGIQSGSDQMLKKLGRLHSADDGVKTVEYARKLGFDNISADLMIGLPNSDLSTLSSDIKHILSLDTEHISAYILKKEKGTPLYNDGTVLPLEDDAANQYLSACEMLEKAGYTHYEISNFCKSGYESRHNLKYWQAKEYIGIGASAHSFYNGKRFYYPRDIRAFINSPKTVFDGIGGTKEEKLMLGLRLSVGVNLAEYFGDIPFEIQEKLAMLKAADYIEQNGDFIRLTDKGMLVSNSIITELII